MSERKTKVRIAPSPSGYLHVGTARTAIFNFLFARKHGGQFLIRIEDTDKERSDASLVKPILDSLKWLGMESDAEIVYQSQRIELHKKQAQKILESGHAYRCFCTPEELQAEREKSRAEKKPPRYSMKCFHLSDNEIKAKLDAQEKFAIRLHISEGETTYRDMVIGEAKRQNVDIEDFIIARSDGTAVYNLAVVIDDHDMEITDVIRGNDHITNTFKQIHIYRALGYEIPNFGHVPLILRPDKKKVSKRLGDKDVGEYKAEGIIPEAMFNYLSLLGWSPKTEREIYNRQELQKLFTEKNFNSSNAIFDEDKLIAFNKEHIQLMDTDLLNSSVGQMFVEAGKFDDSYLNDNKEYFSNVISVLKQRVRKLVDFISLGSYFFTEVNAYEEKADEKHFTNDKIELLEILAERFSQLTSFDHESTEKIITELSEEKEIKKAVLIHPTRLAVSGMSVGPGLYDLLTVLGKETVVNRLKDAVIYIEKKT